MLHNAEIRQIVKFSGEGSTRASITFRIGSLVIRNARLMETEGRLWLAMPSKRMNNGNWFHLVSICDREAKKELEQLAIKAYENAVQDEETPQLIPAF